MDHLVKGEETGYMAAFLGFYVGSSWSPDGRYS